MLKSPCTHLGLLPLPGAAGLHYGSLFSGLSSGPAQLAAGLGASAPRPSHGPRHAGPCQRAGHRPVPRGGNHEQVSSLAMGLRNHKRVHTHTKGGLAGLSFI